MVARIIPNTSKTNTVRVTQPDFLFLSYIMNNGLGQLYCFRILWKERASKSYYYNKNIEELP